METNSLLFLIRAIWKQLPHQFIAIWEWNNKNNTFNYYFFPLIPNTKLTETNLTVKLKKKPKTKKE